MILVSFAGSESHCNLWVEVCDYELCEWGDENETKDELKWEWLLCGVPLTGKVEKAYGNDKI